MLDQLNYAAVTLKSQWAFIKKLAQIQCFNITERMDDHFDHILAECRPIADDKMPVSRKLLVELLSVSEQTFQEYNAALFQAMVLTAWGACMRISKYSFSRAHLPDHNVRRGAVLPGKKGLSVEFYSDKFTKLHAAVKHRSSAGPFYPEAQRQCWTTTSRSAQKQPSISSCRWTAGCWSEETSSICWTHAFSKWNTDFCGSCHTD